MQTCPKMRYKVEFAPADLLCPKHLVWIPFEQVEGFLDRQEGRVLCDAQASLDEPSPGAIPRQKQLSSLAAKVSLEACPTSGTLSVSLCKPPLAASLKEASGERTQGYRGHTMRVLS